MRDGSVCAGVSCASTTSQPKPEPRLEPEPRSEPEEIPRTKIENPAVEAGEDAGNYTIISTLEFGYRGLRVDGDLNKYRSDLNYKAGPRLFDSSFFLRDKDGKGVLFDTLLVTSTGWGADPYGNMRISVEKPKWYRLEGTYRRFKYFRFVNNLANPNWVFSPASFSVPPNPVTGGHGYNTQTQLGDFDLTLLPKNAIRFTLVIRPRDTADRHSQVITPAAASLISSRSSGHGLTIFELAPTAKSVPSTFHSCKASAVFVTTVLSTSDRPPAQT